MNSFSWWIGQVSLVALSFWSFHFASVCAFGLLAYVGYIIYAFPSLFRLHRLNGLLLVFILLWAVSTYIFNVAFTFLNWKIGKVVLSSGNHCLNFTESEFNCFHYMFRTWTYGRWSACGIIPYLDSFCLHNFVLEYWLHWVILWTTQFSFACLMRMGDPQMTIVRSKVLEYNMNLIVEQLVALLY